MTGAIKDEESAAAEGGAETYPRWFGPRDRPLFGVVHRPAAGRARGGVVLCAPLASELNYTYYMMRTLAARLAAVGLLVVRFDYDGTGQSAGDTNDPERVRAFLGSVDAAVSLVRAQGVDWIAGAGLRLGATLLAAAVDAGTELDALALLDPCLSGRGFLREQRALLGTSDSPATELEGTEISGYLYSPQTSADIGALELPESLSGLRGPAITLLDASRPGSVRLRRRLEALEVRSDEYRLPGTMFDTGLLAYELPEPVLAPVVSWLDGVAPASRHPLRETVPSSRAVVSRDRHGSPIEERIVRIGSGRLVAIEAEGVAGGARPTVVFPSIAAEPSVGAGRLWVDLSRRWAEEGFRCLRVDISGVGESDPRPGEAERVIYSPTALEDLREVCTFASGACGTVLVGMCSGAYAILSMASQLKLDGAVAVNPYLTLRAFQHSRSSGTETSASVEGSSGGSEPGPVRTHVALRRLAGAISGLGRNVEWRERLLDHFPTALWWLLIKLGLAFSPGSLVTPAVDAGIPLLLICGDLEGQQAKRRAPRAFQRLAGAPHSRFVLVPGLDHSLRVASHRRDAVATMTDFLTALPASRRLPGPPPPVSGGRRAAVNPEPSQPSVVG